MPKLKTKKTYKYKRKSRNSFSFHGGLFSNLPFFILSSSLAALLLLVVAFKYSDKLNISVLSSLTSNDAGKTRFYPLLDPRLSISYDGNLSFDSNHQKSLSDMFTTSKRAYILGFNSINLPMRQPSSCYRRNTGDVGIPENCIYEESLTDLASNNNFPYKNTFNLPILNYVLDIDAISKDSLNQSDISQSSNEFKSSDSKTQKLYDEVYDFANHLLNTYQNTNKKFVLVFGNNLESLITNEKCDLVFAAVIPNPSNCINSTDANDTKIANTILYLNTISDAIDKAESDNSSITGVKLYHATSVDHVLVKREELKSALTQVLPETDLDLYGYSANELMLLHYDDNSKRPAVMMIQALNKIAKYAPDNDEFDKKNVFVNDFGLNELRNFNENAGGRSQNPESNNNKNTAFNKNYFTSPLMAALNWRAPFVNFSSLYDEPLSDCNAKNRAQSVKDDACSGFGILKVDNSPTKFYENLSKFRMNVTLRTDNKSDGKLYNNAQFQGATVNGIALAKYRAPNGMFILPAGEDLKFRINFKNTGVGRPWTKIRGYNLKTNIIDGNNPGIPLRLEMKDRVIVRPNNNYIFEFTLNVKDYTEAKVSWKMNQKGIEDFGANSFEYDFIFDYQVRIPVMPRN